tara:strand:- start:68 stop:385 length:318 start_codon:yes stop_codon:yes gene_type:complete
VRFCFKGKPRGYTGDSGVGRGNQYTISVILSLPGMIKAESSSWRLSRSRRRLEIPFFQIVLGYFSMKEGLSRISGRHGKQLVKRPVYRRISFTILEGQRRHGESK